jgi:transcriptional regulator with XRE-family HTH domain/tetratricopeptide (TPR) repeat protein
MQMDSESKVPNIKLRYQRELRGWSQKRLADQIDTSKEMVSKWEGGQNPGKYYQEKLCNLFGKSAQELGFLPEPEPDQPSLLSPDNSKQSSPKNDDLQETLAQAVTQGIMGAVEKFGSKRNQDLNELCRKILEVTPGITIGKTAIEKMPFLGAQTLSISSVSAKKFLPQCVPQAELWADDVLDIYARGIAACQDLYYNGNPHQVEAILPLYSHQTALLAQQTGPLQRPAARLASQVYQLACELATDREDFGTARQAGQQAFSYAQLAGDSNLQVAALISLANLGWHLSFAQPCFICQHSKNALQTYKQAVSLLDETVTPLLKGRTYAGMAEVYAMRGQFQEAMQAMGLAYEHFPMKPEDDPAYPYLRASRYALYVFGDAQSRLLLNQPKEAEKALIAMQKETNDPEIEPITKVDLLYYQAEAQIQQGEIKPSVTLLTEAAMLAKSLGSRLYFNKLAASYYRLKEQWPGEPLVVTLEEVFQLW